MEPAILFILLTSQTTLSPRSHHLVPNLLSFYTLIGFLSAQLLIKGLSRLLYLFTPHSLLNPCPTSCTLIRCANIGLISYGLVKHSFTSAQVDAQ